MMEERLRDQALESQTAKQYELIRRFYSSFSKCRLWLETGTMLMFPGAGQRDTQEYARIFLASRSMSEVALLRILETMLVQCRLRNDSPQNQIVDRTFKDFRERIIPRRDNLSHAIAFIGHGNEESSDYHRLAFRKETLPGNVPGKLAYKSQSFAQSYI